MLSDQAAGDAMREIEGLLRARAETRASNLRYLGMVGTPVGAIERSVAAFDSESERLCLWIFAKHGVAPTEAMGATMRSWYGSKRNSDA